jgi:hypothetical protein
MTDKEAEDFASTKHKGLPEKIDEFLMPDALIGGDVVDIQPRSGEVPFEINGNKFEFETATYDDGRKDIVVYSHSDDVYYDYQKWREAMGIDKSIDEIAPLAAAAVGSAAGGFGQAIGNRVADKVGLEEHHLSTREEKMAYLTRVCGQLMPDSMVDQYLNMLGSASDEEVHDAYLKAEQALREKGVDPASIAETMIEPQEDSMKMKPPVGDMGGGDMPMGLQTAGGITEDEFIDTTDMEKELEQFNEEFERIKKHQNKLQEDRKPSTLVMKDRLGSDAF